jgi:hypothetical protein
MPHGDPCGIRPASKMLSKHVQISRVIRRVFSERPALTAGDLLDAMKAFEGRGAGPRRRRSRDAAA